MSVNHDKTNLRTAAYSLRCILGNHAATDSLESNMMEKGKNMKNLLVFLLLSIVLLVPVVRGYGNDAVNPERKSLRGLAGVYVLVEKLDPDDEALGISEEQFRTKAELELRKAGIRVLTREEYIKNDRSPYIYINMSLLQPGGELGLVVVSLQVSLEQTVTLGNGDSVAASTWNKAVFGSMGKEDVQSIRSETLPRLIEEFANDFLAANSANPKAG